MKQYFEKQKWSEILKKKDWYLKIYPLYQQVENKRDIKNEIYAFFEKHLKEEKIFLGKTGPNWDKERKKIKKVIIHHTKEPSGISWEKLSVIQLLRLYAAQYVHIPIEKEKYLNKDAIYSNHFRGGIQVFYAYHWLIRRNGNIERLLKDCEIGWHSGDWQVNCESVAICLDGNFENCAPSNVMLNAIIKLIRDNYSWIKAKNIFGHREINKKTDCPGNMFTNGWKNEIIKHFMPM